MTMNNPETTIEQPHHAERSSTEIVYSLFGPSTGLCWGDFSCSHRRQRGRLYAASNAIAFFSNLFGFEKRLLLELEDVSSIQAYRTTSVCITAVTGEQYIFKSFKDRELVVALLLQLMQKVRPDFQVVLNESINSECSQYDDVEENPEQSTDEGAKNETHSGSLQDRRSPCPIEPTREIDKDSVADDEDSMQSDRLSSASHEAGPEHDPQQAWETAKLANDPPYMETAVNDLELPCTLDEFFALFLADNAPHSIDSYQKSVVGDTELSVSPWTTITSESSTVDTRSRTIQFRHALPNSLGIGLKSALAERHQTFCRHGEFGFCLTTHTYVKGVVASDTFYVDDQWIVESHGETNISLAVRHQVRFTKRTMLKRLIVSSTNTEVVAWFAGYCKMLVASLEGREVPKESSHKEEEPEEASLKTPGRFSKVVVLMTNLWGFIMVGMILLLWQRGARLDQKVEVLEEELFRLRTENIQAFSQLENYIAELKTNNDHG